MTNGRTNPKLRWAVRVVLALLLVVGGILTGRLIRGSSPSAGPVASARTTTTISPTTTTSTTVPPETNGQDIQTMENGCISLQEFAQFLTDAEGDNDWQYVREIESSETWTRIQAMEQVGGQMAYQQLAGDTLQMAQDLYAAETIADLGSVDSDLTTLEQDCSELGYATTDSG